MAESAAPAGARGFRGWRFLAWGTGAALILLPLVGMWFTQEVNWGPEDFGFAAALVVGVGVAYEFAVRMTRDWAYRGAVAVALGTAFILLWGNAAVGFIGSEDNPANLMFFGVLAVAVLGALLARFRPRGMALALVATAVAQVTVAAIALVAGFGFTGPLTVFFTALWLTSAWLFRKAASRRTQPGG
jgi:hypothetical protein